MTSTKQNPTTWTDADTPVGIAEIATMAGVTLYAARALSYSGKLPHPAATV